MAVSSHLFPLFVVYLGVEIARSAEIGVLDHRVFLWQIIEKYGHNGSIPYEGFERLYENLGLGEPLSVLGEAEGPGGTVLAPAAHSRNSRDSEKVNNKTICKSQEELAKMILQHREVPSEGDVRPPPRSCLSVREVLSVYGLPLGETLGPVTFLHLCPAIVYQLDQGTCVRHGGGHRHEHTVRGTVTQSSWLFACLSWLVISMSGLMIVAIVPLLQNTLVNQLITFLVALAVGTLLGDAFLHLVPHALTAGHGSSEEDSHTDSVMKTGLMFLTVVFFFTFESVLNTVRSNKDKQKPQEPLTYVAVSVNENEKEMMELTKTAPQLQHSVSHGHHGHSHSPQSNTALMVIMGEGLHKLTDGLAIGASFSGGLAPGFATALAVFTHELPHELGDFAVLLQSGVPVRRALLYNLLSSVLSLLGTVLGLIIGNFGDSTQWVFAITAGCFTYIALSSLVPEINRQKSDWGAVVMRLSGILSGGALMACIAVYEHDLQHLFS